MENAVVAAGAGALSENSLRQALRHCGRNAGVVLLFYTLTAQLRRPSRRRPRTRAALKDPESWGPRPGRLNEAARTALAVFLCGMTRHLVRRRYPEVAAAVASMVPLRLLLSSSRQYKVAYDILAVMIIAPVLIEAVPALRRSPMLVMLLATAQLLTSWIVSDDGLPPDYIRFLNGQSRMRPGGLQEMRRCICSNPPLTGRELTFRTVWPEDRWKIGHAVQSHFCPTGASPAAGTVLAALDFFTQHLPQKTLPFYAKMYIVQLGIALARQRKAPLVPLLLQHLQGCVRSSLFLSCYVTWTWSFPIWLGAVRPNMLLTPAKLWVLFLTPAPWLLLENPVQQRQISSYCAPFGLYPFLRAVPLGFDAGLLAAVAAIGAGKVSRPMLLRLLWPD